MGEKLKRTVYILFTMMIFGWRLLAGNKDSAQRWLFERLSYLGGIYIKFLQLLAIKEDVKDIRFSGLKDVLTVFDQVSYEDIPIQKLLYAELGSKASHLRLDSAQPFAAGSFGQVYSATLGEQPVIIKVLRPSVIKFLNFDLALLGVVTRLFSFLQPQSMLDIKRLFSDFKSVTLKEVDYQHEAQMARAIKENLTNHSVIVIPTTHQAYSTKHIIVQDKVSGIPLTDILSNAIEDKVGYVWQNLYTDLNYVMEELAVELLNGSLSTVGTHGDPHPGNIYILPNNKVALIDFGIEAAVDKYQPELIQLITQYVALYRGEFNPHYFSRALVGYFVPQLTASLESLSAYFGKQDLVEKIFRELGKSASDTLYSQAGNRAVSAMLEQYRMLALFTQVINRNNRFGLQVEVEAPAFLRSTQIFLNIVHRLGCDKQLLRRSFERVLALHEDLNVPKSIAYDNESIDRSLHSVAEWFERLHYSDPALYNRITNTWRTVV